MFPSHSCQCKVLVALLLAVALLSAACAAPAPTETPILPAVPETPTAASAAPADAPPTSTPVPTATTAPATPTADPSERFKAMPFADMKAELDKSHDIKLLFAWAQTHGGEVNEADGSVRFPTENKQGKGTTVLKITKEKRLVSIVESTSGKLTIASDASYRAMGIINPAFIHYEGRTIVLTSSANGTYLDGIYDKVMKNIDRSGKVKRNNDGQAFNPPDGSSINILFVPGNPNAAPEAEALMKRVDGKNVLRFTVNNGALNVVYFLDTNKISMFVSIAESNITGDGVSGDRNAYFESIFQAITQGKMNAYSGTGIADISKSELTALDFSTLPQ